MSRLFTAKTNNLDGEFRTHNILEALSYLAKVGGLTPYQVIFLNDEYREARDGGQSAITDFTGKVATLEWSSVDFHIDTL